MKYLLLLLLSLATLSLHAQTFEELIAEGDALYDSEKYLKAAKNYEKALEMSEGDAGLYYNAACYWALTGDTIKSMKYLKFSAEKGWTNKDWMHRDPDLKSLQDVKGWDTIVAKVQANKDEMEKDMDKPLKAKLEKIYVQDQTLRQTLGEVQGKFGRDSEEMIYFWEVIGREDKRNEEEVIKIIEERGWVGRSQVGGKANSALWLVVQHAPLEIQEKYLPLLKESVTKGESSGNHLALLEDRILMRNGQPQTYGSQVSRDQESGEWVVHEIKDPEYVNQRRKEVGLGPIQDYLKRWDIEWTVEQKER